MPLSKKEKLFTQTYYSIFGLSYEDTYYLIDGKIMKEHCSLYTGNKSWSEVTIDFFKNLILREQQEILRKTIEDVGELEKILKKVY